MGGVIFIVDGVVVVIRTVAVMGVFIAVLDVVVMFTRTEVDLGVLVPILAVSVVLLVPPFLMLHFASINHERSFILLPTTCGLLYSGSRSCSFCLSFNTGFLSGVLVLMASWQPIGFLRLWDIV